MGFWFYVHAFCTLWMLFVFFARLRDNSLNGAIAFILIVLLLLWIPYFAPAAAAVPSGP